MSVGGRHVAAHDRGTQVLAERGLVVPEKEPSFTY
jgi:hypothetical protein